MRRGRRQSERVVKGNDGRRYSACLDVARDVGVWLEGLVEVAGGGGNCPK